MDVMSTEANGKELYAVTFIDDFSKLGMTYFVKTKDETMQKFMEYQTSVENQLTTTIKVIRTDRGGEYMSNELNNHLLRRGIILITKS